ncbi:hypothetical protein E2C01_015690 [Portunus trituberculatus]|uniref:Uncharacterized protein n=1 Tax=Portunus trituberculatus TaxID=210409 RepID=A0A5B7DNH1_PORTR|nr:hypothetical protein [Portunus trituberculatus]
MLLRRYSAPGVELPEKGWQTPAPACLCAVSAAAPTDQPTAPAESLSLHVLQQQAAVTAGARRNPPLAAVTSSTEACLASVKASLHHHVCSLLFAGPPRRPLICESRLGALLRSLRSAPGTPTGRPLLRSPRRALPRSRRQCPVSPLLPGSRFPWAFVVVDVEQAILGMDFLAAHDLQVDPRRRCLLHHPSANIIHAEPCVQPTPSLTTLRQVMQFESLL